jgi:hypothetical protein
MSGKALGACHAVLSGGIDGRAMRHRMLDSRCSGSTSYLVRTRFNSRRGPPTTGPATIGPRTGARGPLVRTSRADPCARPGGATVREPEGRALGRRKTPLSIAGLVVTTAGPRRCRWPEVPRAARPGAVARRAPGGVRRRVRRYGPPPRHSRYDRRLGTISCVPARPVPPPWCAPRRRSRRPR